MVQQSLNSSTALVVLRKAVQALARRQLDTAEGLLDRYETKLGRQRHISCLARATLALRRGQAPQAQTLVQRAGVLLHANADMSVVEYDALVYLVKEMEADAGADLGASLDRFQSLLATLDPPDRGVNKPGAEASGESEIHVAGTSQGD